MKHYCNRQTPKNDAEVKNKKEESTKADDSNRVNGDERKKPTNTEDKKSVSKDESAEDDSNKNTDIVVLPPGCDTAYLKDYLKKTDTVVWGYKEEQDANGNNQNQYGLKNGGYKPIQNFNRVSKDSVCKKDSLGVYDDMQGRYNFMSVPQNSDRCFGGVKDAYVLKVKENYFEGYLKGYLNKYICAEIWTNQRVHIEKCGVLKEVGKDHMVIKGANGAIAIIDLRSVAYISVFCR